MDEIDELKKGFKQINLKNYEKAINHFKEILSKNKEKSDVWVLLGFCQLKLKEFEKAYSSFNNALKIDDKDSFAWSGKAYLLFLAKKYKKSLLYCNIALKYYPNNTEAIKIKKNIKKALLAIENEEISKEEIDYKINKISIEDLLNSFNEMNITTNEKYPTVKLNILDLDKKDGLTTISNLNEFENIFTKKRIKLLVENCLTVDEYNKILLKIKEVGKNNFKQIIKENNINLNEISIFKKITLLTLAYSDIEYKTKGVELGSYHIILLI